VKKVNLLPCKQWTASSATTISSIGRLPALAPSARTFAKSRPTRLAFALLVLLLGCGLRVPPAEAATITEQASGRSMILYVPDRWSSDAGAHLGRGLVVVLHGGMGNASRIEERGAEAGLNMDAVASATPATRALGGNFLAWNAGGGCCGQAALNAVDDIGYIESVTAALVSRFQLDPKRLFVMGHSNGAMMSQLLMCKSNLFSAAVAISGPLNLASGSCSGEAGKRILAIHGSADDNVPVDGGRGSKGISGVAFQSERHSETLQEAAGAIYQLQLLPGVDHNLERINAAIQNSEQRSVAEKAALFFGLRTQATRP
jgi:polyhydroxybutyrate depolymerase